MVLLDQGTKAINASPTQNFHLAATRGHENPTLFASLLRRDLL